MRVWGFIASSSLILGLAAATPDRRASGEDDIGEVYSELLADTFLDVSAGLEPTEGEAKSPKLILDDFGENETSLQAAPLKTWDATNVAERRRRSEETTTAKKPPPPTSTATTTTTTNSNTLQVIIQYIFAAGAVIFGIVFAANGMEKANNQDKENWEQVQKTKLLTWWQGFNGMGFSICGVIALLLQPPKEWSIRVGAHYVTGIAAAVFALICAGNQMEKANHQGDSWQETQHTKLLEWWQSFNALGSAVCLAVSFFVFPE